MHIAVIDGQGGGMGKAMVEKLRCEFNEDIEIAALGTNVLATALMLKAGANEGASGENAVVRLITLPDEKRDIVNDIMITSGRYFSNADSNQCLVEEGFFKAHSLKTGDYISPIINGTEVKLKVIGSVKSPEYVYTLKDGSELMPDNRKFGIVFVKKSFGQAILGFYGSINNLSMLINEGTDVDKAKNDVKKY